MHAATTQQKQQEQKICIFMHNKNTILRNELVVYTHINRKQCQNEKNKNNISYFNFFFEFF